MQGIVELSARQVELLIVLAEECAEVQQAISKLLRHGPDERFPSREPSPTNAEALEDELTDLYAVLAMIATSRVISYPRVLEGVSQRIEEKKMYMYHYEEAPPKEQQQ